jgi:hypothetical protein
VSPLRADLSGLPPLLIQAAEHEALFPGAARLAERAAPASRSRSARSPTASTRSSCSITCPKRAARWRSSPPSRTRCARTKTRAQALLTMRPSGHIAKVNSGVPVLVSVNVGLPKDVPWQGRTVYTGVWKHQVDGPRMVRRLNIDGDGQGDLNGHGGEQRAVLVYQRATTAPSCEPRCGSPPSAPAGRVRSVICWPALTAAARRPAMPHPGRPGPPSVSCG